MLAANLQPLIAVQAFWLSLIVIGYAIVQGYLLARKQSLSDHYRGLPLFAQLVIYFMAAAALFAGFTIAGYLFTLPAWWLGFSYFATLLASLVYVALKLRQTVRSDLYRLYRWITSLRLLSLGSALIFMLAIDYGSHLLVGGNLGGDGFIHMAKIWQLAEAGFVFTDAYYGTVPETRHHISVMHTLYAIPTYLGVQAVNSWYFSVAFLQLMKYSAVFLMAYILFTTARTGRGETYKYVILATILFVVLFASTTPTGVYPSSVAGIWMMLWFVGLMILVRNGRPELLLAGSLLTAVTHPLYSMSLALLLSLVGVLLLAFARQHLTKKMVISAIVSGLILLSTPVLTYFFQNQMTEAAYNYGEEGYRFWSVFGIEAFKPRTWSVAIADTVLPNWAAISVSATGVAFLIWRTKSRALRLVFIATAIFVPLVLHFPPIFQAINSVLPYWALNRFGSAALLVPLSLILGVIALATWATQHSARLSRYRFAAVATVVVALGLTAGYGTGYFSSLPTQSNSRYKVQRYAYNELAELRDLLSGLDSGHRPVILADRRTSFFIPAISNMNVLAIRDSNSSPAADMYSRMACYDRLSQTFDLAEMEQVGVGYILMQLDSDWRPILDSRSDDFEVLAKSKRYMLYAVKRQVQPASSETCDFNESSGLFK